MRLANIFYKLARFFGKGSSILRDIEALLSFDSKKIGKRIARKTVYKTSNKVAKKINNKIK